MKLRNTLLATAILAATPAHAATYLATYSGTVSGYDNSGIFGAPGALNDPFTAVYTITSPLPGAITEAWTWANGDTVDYHGGDFYGASVPSPVSATLTIKGVTHAFTGSRLGDSWKQDGVDTIYHQADSDVGTWINTYVYSYDNDFINNTDQTMPLDYVVQAADTATGSFSIGMFVTGGWLTPTRVTVTAADTGAVPEPATWATMIIGFGFVGAAMRKRHHVKIAYS